MLTIELLRQTVLKYNNHIIALACVGIGMALGLQYGASNHAIYVPPGIRLADPSYLAHDWWATEVHHYHWAFFLLVAGLKTAGILPWGLAIGNVLCVALTMWMVWLIVCQVEAKQPALIWGILAYVFLITKGMPSVAGSYLFSSYLQASNLSTAATMVALYTFLQHRMVATGIFLGVAGIFHANFLILNGALFGLVHFFQNAPLSFTSRSKWGNWFSETVWLIGPTALIIGISMPLILSISQTELQPNEAALARNILFDLAGPWHYKPTTFLVDFFDLAGWQLLGLCWTWLAIPHNSSRRFWLTLQGVLIVMIWTATALTTVIFIEQVSRFFVWRLAPFSMLIALLLFLCGAMRALHEPRPNFRTRVSVLGLSILGLVLVARVLHYHGSVLSFQGAKILSIPLILLGVLSIKWFLPDFWLTCRQLRSLAFSPLVAAMVLIGFGGATFLTLYSFDRYNLLFKTLVPLQKDELYRWVRTHSPSDAQFVIPPLQMEKFRLLAERAIVVDFKNRPLSASHLLEWYRRMEAITGTKNPKTQKELIDGYSQINEVRLETLRKKYGITHAVLPRKGSEHPLVGWSTVFENTAYRVLAIPTKNPQQITKKPAIEKFRVRVDSF